MSTAPITIEFEEVVQRTCSLLVFRLSGQAFALNIDNVVQIIPMLRLTPVPQIDPIIEGIANIHGSLVPVISVRHHLGLPDIKPGLYTPIILTRVGERKSGWIVDEVCDVISVPSEAIIAPATILPEGTENTPVMSGLIYQGDVPILVLDPRYILHPTQFHYIHRVFPSCLDATGMQVAGAQPGPSVPPPEAGDDFETTHVPPSLLAAPETMCAALAEEESHLESEAGEATLPAVSEIEQTPEQPVKNRKQSTKRSGKANRKKGAIIPNTSNSKPEQTLQQILRIEPKGRSIQAELATQFSELADEVRKTEEQYHTGE